VEHLGGCDQPVDHARLGRHARIRAGYASAEAQAEIVCVLLVAGLPRGRTTAMTVTDTPAPAAA
jgi:hypothetical protein